MVIVSVCKLVYVLENMVTVILALLQLCFLGMVPRIVSLSPILLSPFHGQVHLD